MHNRSCRAENRKCRRILNAVIRLNKLNLKSAKLHDISVFDDIAFCRIKQVVFPQFVLNERHGQCGCIDRNIDITDHKRQRTDMILMTVRDDKTFYTFYIFFQIRDIRNDKINSEHVILGKGQSAIDNDNRITVFKRGDVHADCLQPSEGNDF